jgi:hypothetical protein
MAEWHFVDCYRPEKGHQRELDRRFRFYSFDE